MGEPKRLEGWELASYQAEGGSAEMNLCAHIAWQDGEIARLREALLYYADHSHWHKQEFLLGESGQDAGCFARDALATPPSVYAQRAQKVAAVVEAVREDYRLTGQCPLCYGKPGHQRKCPLAALDDVEVGG